MKSDIEKDYERVQALADSLTRINREMKRMLEKLPLTDHRDVLRISQLAEKQLQIMRMNVGPSAPRSRVFLDNARFSAMNLRRRYQEALQQGKLRGTRGS